ncbi:MAG: ribbon-helix-helix domain-containing protein [Candidatus Nanohaloarchaea archaeon]
MGETDSVPTKFPSRMVEEMNEIVEDGWYANRSELVRDAVRQKIREMKSEQLEDAIKEDVKWGLNE